MSETDNSAIEAIEEAIPDERKNLSFGGSDEGLMDVLDKHESEMHHRGEHMEEELESCPSCPDPENRRVAPEVLAFE